MAQIQTKTLDTTFINDVYLDKNNIEAQVTKILARNLVYEKENYKKWLIKAVSVIDLTTLSGDDTRSNVTRLCIKAAKPLSQLGIDVQTAAVCVYPNRVSDAFDTITRMEQNGINIASVATGFPSGLYPLKTRVQEIEYAVSKGANEIDVVLDRSLVLTGQWETLYKEVVEMKQACGDAHLKVILGVGELGTYENVYCASMVSMLAGADFIKTSTGKEAVNATLPVGLVMCRAIRTFFQITGFKIKKHFMLIQSVHRSKSDWMRESARYDSSVRVCVHTDTSSAAVAGVGLKPAGGIKTARDAVNWLVLIQTELGSDWLTPKLFRIGASSLLAVIEKELK